MSNDFYYKSPYSESPYDSPYVSPYTEKPHASVTLLEEYRRSARAWRDLCDYGDSYDKGYNDDDADCWCD